MDEKIEDCENDNHVTVIDVDDRPLVRVLLLKGKIVEELSLCRLKNIPRIGEQIYVNDETYLIDDVLTVPEKEKPLPLRIECGGDDVINISSPYVDVINEGEDFEDGVSAFVETNEEYVNLYCVELKE